MKTGAVIPCYNHGSTLVPIVEALVQQGLPVLIVNDGSNAATTEQIQCLTDDTTVLSLHLAENGGKGHAVMAGLRFLYEKSYTHALQIDADGQHDWNMIPEFVKLSHQFPNDVISGVPVYDQAIPKTRLIGRYATHLSVWLETLSFEIKDAMIGFRIYPLNDCIRLFDSHSLGQQMDFDIEILVRLYWQGLSIRSIRVPVYYPEHGISHFKALDDNLKISWLHTRLIAGMLTRIPQLITRHKVTVEQTLV